MSLLKNGWHPAGDKEIRKATWRKDLMSIGSKKDADADRARSHVSTPLQNLKDPDSFGPPPKHSAYYPNANPGRTNTASSSGSSTTTRQTKATKQDEQGERASPQAYSVNTTGLRTDNLPPPPGRRDVPPTPTARDVPPTPVAARPVPPPPPRTASGPPPVLPPRQSENPSEYDPPAPPTYGEAIRAPALQAAAGRLGQGIAGVDAVTRSPQSAQGHGGQSSELQQRFARMNTGSEAPSPASPSWKQDSGSSSPAVPSWKQAQAAYGAVAASPVSTQSVAALAGQKKKPPPPPMKKPELGGDAPPPIPMSSKPRPG